MADQPRSSLGSNARSAFISVMKNSGKLTELFLSFFKIGLFTFGGGYAMISLIEDLCVDKKKWISEEEMMDLTVIAESTPGPIAINCATYVGYRRGGIAGAVAATVGVVLPSFIIIYLITVRKPKTIPSLPAPVRS